MNRWSWGLVVGVFLVGGVGLADGGDRAGKRVAVLEFGEGAGVSAFELQTLADEVRGAVLRAVPRTWVVMTRENLQVLLPPGTDLARCQSETQCEVELGRTVGADLVVSGSLGRFAGELSATLKLYDTRSGALLSQRSCGARDLKGLREAVQAGAVDLVREGVRGPGATGPDFQVTALPAVPQVEVPRALGAEAMGGMDFRSVDVEGLERYDRVVRLEEGSASPEEKERAWRELARTVPAMRDRALARAEEWRRYREAEAARQKARADRERSRREDFDRLWRLLQLRVVPEESKRTWAARFVEAYGTGLADNPDCGRLRPWLDPKVRCEGPPGYVVVGPGRFRMGSPESEPGRDGDEGPVHEVTIGSPYFLKATEVTQGEWRALMGNNPSRFQGCGDDCPVEQVNWWEAVAYCNALSRKEGLEECYVLEGCNGKRPGEGMKCQGARFKGTGCSGYRLPTEAEWEYAARSGGQEREYPWGNETPTCERAVFGHPRACTASDPCGCGRNMTWPVCSRPGGNTGQGLCDMAGNVWEWVQDWYHDTYKGAPTDGRAWEEPSGTSRVFRGGSWYDDSLGLRASNRGRDDPGIRSDIPGLSSFEVGSLTLCPLTV